MNSELISELKKALIFIKPGWKMQTNFNDFKSKFIYYVKTVDEVIKNAKKNNISTEYALHRWYNYHTSSYFEQLFVEMGAIKEKNIKDKEVDIYIDNIPFDIKITVYPNALSNHPYDLNTRDGKNLMIKWLYKNQSQQQRKHFKNRIFIICDGKTQYDSLCLKSDFEQIRNKIKIYFEDIKKNGFNEMIIDADGKKYLVKSDIIYLN